MIPTLILATISFLVIVVFVSLVIRPKFTWNKTERQLHSKLSGLVWKLNGDQDKIQSSCGKYSITKFYQKADGSRYVYHLSMYDNHKFTSLATMYAVGDSLDNIFAYGLNNALSRIFEPIVQNYKEKEALLKQETLLKFLES